MRIVILPLLLFLFFEAHSEEFTVFEKEGYYGIKDKSGQITVPPVYEKLGWSTGQTNVFNGVIGYKSGNNWGLISIRNKPLTEQKFYSLTPFKDGYIKGSIKGKFSNHLFHGLLDTRGKTVVSFNYFDLTQFRDILLVSQFANGRELFGLISMENDIRIPLKYKNVTIENGFQLATSFSHTIDVYHNYLLVQSSLDSLQFNQGIIGYRTGYAGYISMNGTTSQPFKFKSIQFENGVAKGINFPTWKVYLDRELQFEELCDSLQKTTNKIWISFLNRAQHVTLPQAQTFDSKNYLVKSIENDRVILQHSKTRKFSVIDITGKFLISGYDSIYFSGTHFIGLKKNKWSISNSSGTQLHKVPFNKVISGPKNFFIAFKNEHWGVVDFNGDNYITFKYDSIIPTQKHYQVKYLNKWGALDFHGNWIVQPDYNEIQSFGEVIIGRRGLGYSVFHNSQFKFKTVSKPIKSFNDIVIMEGDSSRLGLLNSFGDILADPLYKEINAKDSFFELKKENYLVLITKTGKEIFNESHEIEEIGVFSENYLSIKKNGRWGFVDETGMLRISNRYDNAHIFKEGLAAVKIRNKWGFINKDEKLMIQPYYDNFSSFNKGLAIVQSNKIFGLIDRNGNTQVALTFKSIELLSTDNYKVEDQTGRFGLVNGEGKFLIRPAYESLHDTGEGIIINQNGQWGYIDYSGNQIFKLKYKDIQLAENFVLLKS